MVTDQVLNCYNKSFIGLAYPRMLMSTTRVVTSVKGLVAYLKGRDYLCRA